MRGTEFCDHLPARVTEGAVGRLVLPACPARTVGFPDFVSSAVTARLQASGISSLYKHQAEALAALVADRAHVVVATGTASGKSLIYQLVAALAVERDTKACVLYLSPTKALGHDQARAMAWSGLRVGVLDGDTPFAERDWIAAYAQVIVSNPDMLNVSLLPRHEHWRRLFRNLAAVVVDECHIYRGVFGAHTAFILRRLLRIARAAGANPVVMGASATTAAPGPTLSTLIGAAVREVTDDASPRGRTHIVLRDPGEQRHGTRREVAEVMAALVSQGRRTLAFVASRAGAETLAATARELLADDGGAAVVAYRAGLLAEERREVEAGLRSGALLGVATTNALELGVDIAGLDAVVLAGWPGRQTSFRQQIGRAGRAGQDALAVLVAADDPLDHYLLAHPQEITGPVTERTVIDLSNPHIVRAHVVAAAAEAPLTDADFDLFGPASRAVTDGLIAEGVLRRRPRGVFWPDTGRPRLPDDIRGIGGSAVRIVEAATGRLLGTVDRAAASATMHAGAVYVHQGEYYLVTTFDRAALVAMVSATTDDVFTVSQSRKHLRVVAVHDEAGLGEGRIRTGSVEVTTAVHSYQRRRRGTGEVLSTHLLELPPQTLATVAVWWSWPEAVIEDLRIDDLAGAVHAAEHAAIGLLPHFATCDRWDIGGLSTTCHESTGDVTAFVFDGQPGGIGYAARGFSVARQWLGSTRTAVAGCACLAGCPRCVQSPKCGNSNNPLDKHGAVALLGALVATT